jgi:hypothetical protein
MHLVSGFRWGYSIPNRIATGIRSMPRRYFPTARGGQSLEGCCAQANVCCWRRVAISNRRLIAFDQHGVTFRYKHSSAAAGPDGVSSVANHHDRAVNRRGAC